MPHVLSCRIRCLQKISGRWVPVPLGWGVADSQEYTAPHVCYCAKFGRSRSNGTRGITDPPGQFDPSHPTFRGHGLIGYL